MQIAPSELRGMSLWELSAMIKGWNRAHETDKKPELPEDVAEELFEFIHEPPAWIN